MATPKNWAMAPPYHYHGPEPQPQSQQQEEEAAPAAEGEGGGVAGSGEQQPRSLRIGGLLDWMNEEYLRSCFTRSPELLSAVVKRNKETGKSECFGYLNFADHATADQILQSYNGQKMPNADRDFRLSWVTNYPVQKRDDDGHNIYVGDLAFDVTDFMLHHVFKSRYPSVKHAKIAWDHFNGRSKGYGFVVFGDVNERRQAMTEMNGAYCSTRPMRVGPATKMAVAGKYSDSDSNNTRLFVGGLDRIVTDEDLKKAFSPYGELTEVKVIAGKKCGFVTYLNRASAEEAMRILNGSLLGDNTIRISWGRSLYHKQKHDQNQWNGERQGSGPGYRSHPEDPKMHGYTGHPEYPHYPQQQAQETSVQ
ncbi:hypothetical protein BRADI_1g59700v3 [Brachypodium distachyon]|uniref:RRM domain-containing protein n=1 Tax=Brachypodium distachyon TaxID=15368 RepID=A0A2K2DSI2_BRADI|nr:hypothetical protein BRADI_1g59700v3 [Brachypodium distachyon]